MLEKILKFIEGLLNPPVPTLFLDIHRIWYTSKSTIGVLKINGEHECYTLEDEDKIGKGGTKVRGVTAIPAGDYELDVTHSPKYRRDMPVLRNVGGFSGVRIHSGNKAEDTEGCILVGETRGKDVIRSSRKAYSRLFKKIQEAKEAGKKIIVRID